MSDRARATRLFIAASLVVGMALVGALLIRLSAPQAWEILTGRTPQARILAFLKAIRQGDREGALSQWQLPEWQEALPERYAELSRRREAVTEALLAVHLDGDMVILSTEWWTTCCEPHVTCDASNAGGARVHVQVLDDTGAPDAYWFDVFAREQPYWGDAMGNPLRCWVIRDVYPVHEEPLFWRLVYESNVRSLDANSTSPPD
jgi:hypothetical protein